MKKKIVSLALAVVLALSLCACANKEAGNTAAAADTSTAAGSSAAAEENTSKELTKLSLGTSPWPTNMFFYLAKEISVPMPHPKQLRRLLRERSFPSYWKRINRTAVRDWLQPLISRILLT